MLVSYLEHDALPTIVLDTDYNILAANAAYRPDFRLISATHKPLKKMVADGFFREDLYYRISGFPIRLPALRERVEGLPLLAQSLLQRMAGQATPRLSDAALQQLALHSFPGNIRELRNILERARLFADDGVIRPEHLPEDTGLAGAAKGNGHRNDLGELAQALEQFKGSRSELASHLGMSERTLYRRLKALGLH